MVKILNLHNAPGPLIRYAESKQYDAGDSDFTATSLIDEPRIHILEKQYANQITDDPYESPWKYLSTIFHSLMAGATGDGEVSEERIFTEFNGLKISGAMDLQTVLRNDNGDLAVVIGDYKLCGGYALKDTSKWEQQLNIYAWLLEREKPEKKVVGLEVYAFVRDWRMASAERSPNTYPQTPGVTVDLPLWDYEDRERFVAERIQMHLDAKKNLPECSHEGRWPSGKVWQVWDDDKLVETFRLKRDAEKSEAGLEILPTFATYRRCESFCPIAGHCDQFKEWQNTRLPGHERMVNDNED